LSQPTFEPTRTKWYGVRTSNPTGLGIFERGAWWYRSDLKLFAYWDGNMVHYVVAGPAGGILFYGTQVLICPSAGNYVLNVSLSSPWVPTVINRVVSVTNIGADPATDPGTPMAVKASPPIVGMTLIGVGAGTTLTEAVVATGW